MQEKEIIPHLFRTEYQKMIAVLCRLFGLEHTATAEDIVSDTFLSATELWGLKGFPENPTAWLYTVAKNKTKDLLRRDTVFAKKIAPQLKYSAELNDDPEIDFSEKNINDSQLAMIFAVCHPSLPEEAQVALALNLLCGFGAEEIADAFFTGAAAIYKRLSRAKEKLKKENIRAVAPPADDKRSETVLTVLYLLFNEGYSSASQNIPLRKELCMEAMRLTLLLTENKLTDKPAANALLALMCFHSSRFDARINSTGDMILYENQDMSLWNIPLKEKGKYYLNRAATGRNISKYHIEAAIAFWHCDIKNSPEKWVQVLQLYNQLLIIAYSPAAALNRTYALAKVKGKKIAIAEALKLDLKENHLYHSLLGDLYSGNDDVKALRHFNTALSLARSSGDRKLIETNINRLTHL